jgi:hypothetical protein
VQEVPKLLYNRIQRSVSADVSQPIQVAVGLASQQDSQVGAGHLDQQEAALASKSVAVGYPGEQKAYQVGQVAVSQFVGVYLPPGKVSQSAREEEAAHFPSAQRLVGHFPQRCTGQSAEGSASCCIYKAVEGVSVRSTDSEHATQQTARQQEQLVDKQRGYVSERQCDRHGGRPSGQLTSRQLIQIEAEGLYRQINRNQTAASKRAEESQRTQQNCQADKSQLTFSDCPKPAETKCQLTLSSDHAEQHLLSPSKSFSEESILTKSKSQAVRSASASGLNHTEKRVRPCRSRSPAVEGASNPCEKSTEKIPPTGSRCHGDESPPMSSRRQEEESVPPESMSRKSKLAESMSRKSPPTESMSRKSTPAESMSRKSVPAESMSRESSPAENLSRKNTTAESMSPVSMPAESISQESRAELSFSSSQRVSSPGLRMKRKAPEPPKERR